MIKLEQTIKGEFWSTFDWNSIDNEGCIVDLGCLYWDWSNYWLGMKRVIGVDPFEETIPNGAELFKGVLGPSDCKIKMDKPNNDEVAGIVNYNIVKGEENLYEMLSWKTFCKKFNVDKVSILKINIEGSEYSFLDSLDETDFSKINQIVISFHDWLNPEYKELTKKSIELLKKYGYTVISTYFKYGWYLCIKNNFVNTNYSDRLIW
jgi:FkbM family methyltransferase